jgi:hypothetical protein
VACSGPQVRWSNPPAPDRVNDSHRRTEVAAGCDRASAGWASVAGGGRPRTIVPARVATREVSRGRSRPGQARMVRRGASGLFHPTTLLSCGVLCEAGPPARASFSALASISARSRTRTMKRRIGRETTTRSAEVSRKLHTASSSAMRRGTKAVAGRAARPGRGRSPDRADGVEDAVVGRHDSRVGPVVEERQRVGASRRHAAPASSRWRRADRRAAHPRAAAVGGRRPTGRRPRPFSPPSPLLVLEAAAQRGHNIRPVLVSPRLRFVAPIPPRPRARTRDPECGVRCGV